MTIILGAVAYSTGTMVEPLAEQTPKKGARIMVLKFVGAALLTFFFSRLISALPIKGGLIARVALAHFISLSCIFLLVVALRGPLGAFDARQLVIFPPAQFFWFCFDLLIQYRPKVHKPSE